MDSNNLIDWMSEENGNKRKSLESKEELGWAFNNEILIAGEEIKFLMNAETQLLKRIEQNAVRSKVVEKIKDYVGQDNKH